MKEVNICFQVVNSENPYKYIGKAEINKGIIKFCDNNINYIYDREIKRLTKESKDSTLVIDFNKENILMRNDGNEFNIKIHLLEDKSNDKKIDILYKVDEDLINFIIEMSEV